MEIAARAAFSKSEQINIFVTYQPMIDPAEAFGNFLHPLRQNWRFYNHCLKIIYLKKKKLKNIQHVYKGGFATF